MKTGLATCPERIRITLPIFSTNEIHYIPWQSAVDPNLPQLHYKSLKIPPPTNINKTIINALDNLYSQLDLELAIAIREANRKIDEIRETSISTLNDALAYAAFALSLFIILVLQSCLCIKFCEHTMRPSTESTHTHSRPVLQLNSQQPHGRVITNQAKKTRESARSARSQYNLIRRQS